MFVVFLGIDVFVFVSGEIDVFVCVSVWRLKFLYVCVGGGLMCFYVCLEIDLFVCV